MHLKLFPVMAMALLSLFERSVELSLLRTGKNQDKSWPKILDGLEIILIPTLKQKDASKWVLTSSILNVTTRHHNVQTACVEASHSCKQLSALKTFGLKRDFYNNKKLVLHFMSVKVFKRT